MLLAATGGLAGLGPALLATAPPAWAFQAEAQIIETDPNQFAYNPNFIEIYVGDRVRWKNNTDAKHTVTSDSGSPAAFDSDEIPPTKGPEDGWEKRFNQAGTYNYRCKIHASMKGVVQVTDPRVTSTTATTSPPPPPPPPPPTTAPSTTTTTTEPPTTTTTTAPPTTTTTLRPPAGLQPPPVPATAAAPPPPLATSSTTTVPPSTTTTAPPPTTATSVPPPTAPEVVLPGTATSAPPPTGPPATADTGDEETTAAGPISRDGETDPVTVALVGALVAVGLFGAWTLIRVRPGRV
ncbi:MAG TPA: plastocyanin/azurin family copper-binding protein [Acidimicrobiia bacterium]|nr:plastocyanin/azurin family copper-binding protein [Acidimicrobiia bacterium]